jgi:hypothetical protein
MLETDNASTTSMLFSTTLALLLLLPLATCVAAAG